LWNGIKEINTMSIYGLQNIAKRINPSGYQRWVSKNNEYITLHTLDRGENNIAQYIAPLLKDELVFCNKTWFINNQTTRLWEFSADPLARVITKIQSCISYSEGIIHFKHSESLLSSSQNDIEKLNDEYRKHCKRYSDYHKIVSGNGFSSQIIKLLKTYLSNNKFTQLLDTIPYKIAYTNGILDLKTLEFRKGIKPTDYLTETIPFDYEPASKNIVEKVKSELLKICNNKKEHLEYYLSVLGYSMTGDSSIKQEFYYLRGQKGGNGKSIVFEALTTLIPNYVIKMENNVFEKKNTQKHKEIARWRGKRICWSNELTDDRQDSEFIKNVADGTSVTYKVMYGISDNMPITFKAFIVSNPTIQFASDGGMKRRCRTLQFDSEFIEGLIEEDYEKCLFKKDETFGIKLQNEYKHALLGLIFSYSNRFYVNNLKLSPYPIEWNDENNEVLETNNKFSEWFEDMFEIGKTYKISRKKLDETLLLYGSVVNFKDEVKKNRWEFTYDSQERFETTSKGTWEGFRIRPITLPNDTA
jgi:hypothetical protein